MANQKYPKEVILVTGGTGYIGSHTVVALSAAGYTPVIVDNLVNSNVAVLERLAAITGIQFAFHRFDIRDRSLLDAVFQIYPIRAVIHFAGLKAVGESVSEPLSYYDNNIQSTISLCSVMKARGVKRIIFSSSATVYGEPHSVPIQEDFPLAPTNPYGRSKLMIEQILQDLNNSDPTWQIALLRYFNPVGAHESGLIGEDPQGIPNNLMPYISQVAVGRRDQLNVFGSDYPTPDGTGVRDYIHVMDLAEGHVAALRHLENREENSDPLIVNLGTGRGYSVLELLKAFSAASGKAIPYSLTERRSGDIATCYADPARAQRLLGWTAQRDLAGMCADTWRWQSLNPQGYTQRRPEVALPATGEGKGGGEKQNKPAQSNYFQEKGTA